MTALGMWLLFLILLSRALRRRRVLSLFAKAGCAELVLGAWGCGVFGNSPEIVARFFCQELRGRFRGQFRLVVCERGVCRCVCVRARVIERMIAVYVELVGAFERPPSLPPTSPPYLSESLC